ncbi:MAG: hypothetical protein HQK51_18135 [Oligoflexia bacterium]|nr:hypothetical protein [Oligoflexia bacterium]
MFLYSITLSLLISNLYLI